MDFEQLFKRLKGLAGALTVGQQVTLAATFVGVMTLLIGSTYWLNSTSYRLLFSDMDPESAADVVSRLKAQKVKYQLDEGGRAVRVAADRVDELRLDFSSQGLPTSGRMGFEIFDRTAFGATEFLEHVNYRRALEGEIARTIATISEVASARVHIAMAKDSLFGDRQQPAKASVVLKLRVNRPLAASTVNGITSLVSSSVEGLRPDAVVVLDSFGRPLARPAEGDADEPLSGAQAERQQRVEKEAAAKVVALLEPVVGPDNVRVNVSARFNPESQEQTEERWDPNTVVRSRQTSNDGASAAANQGVAGARANLPAATGAPAPAAASAPGVLSARTAETTNYEISRVTRHTIKPRGELARLSVAVLVNDEESVKKDARGAMTRTNKPRSPAELQKIQGLVAAAVGLDTARGDQLTVENIAFDEPLPLEEPAAPGVLQRYGNQISDALRILVVLVIAVCTFFFFVRPVVRRAVAALPAGHAPQLASGLPQQLPRTVQDLEGEIEAQLDAAVALKAGEHRKVPILTKRLGNMATKEPERAARLLRTWLSDDR